MDSIRCKSAPHNLCDSSTTPSAVLNTQPRACRAPAPPSLVALPPTPTVKIIAEERDGKRRAVDEEEKMTQFNFGVIEGHQRHLTDHVSASVMVNDMSQHFANSVGGGAHGITDNRRR